MESEELHYDGSPIIYSIIDLLLWQRQSTIWSMSTDMWGTPRVNPGTDHVLNLFQWFQTLLETLSKVINFADDTVIYLSSKTHTEIEKDLNTDLKNIADYFTTNELVINLKAGKTESLLFGTHKRLNQNADSIQLAYNSQPIASTKEYKYLGTVLDQTLSFATHFQNLYKKTSGRLRLLSSLKACLSSEALLRVYKGILLPT